MIWARTTVAGIREVLKRRGYVFFFLIASLGLLSMLVYIPIVYTPGNSLAFFVQITPWWEFVIVSLLALGAGLSLTMQVYYIREVKNVAVRAGVSSFAAVFSSMIAGLFSSATCAACFGTLFAFLGFGTIITLLDYQWYIAGAGILLVGTSITLTAQGISKKCMACRVTESARMGKRIRILRRTS